MTDEKTTFYSAGLGESVESPTVLAFMEEIRTVCKKHGMTIDNNYGKLSVETYGDGRYFFLEDVQIGETIIPTPVPKYDVNVSGPVTRVDLRALGAAVSNVHSDGGGITLSMAKVNVPSVKILAGAALGPVVADYDGKTWLLVSITQMEPVGMREPMEFRFERAAGISAT